ncbi:MAG TPA: hypothetical protein VFH97_05340 [Gemmatimonadales bacterium]|nr:hypothetical protein [Gemmatimonadales bacterium]
MSWPALAYIAPLLAVGVYSAYDDRKEGVSVPYVATDAAVTLSWVYFVAAYDRPAVAAPRGGGAGVLLAFAVVWTVFDVRRELRLIVAARPQSYDPGLSARANLRVDRSVEALGVLIGTLVMVPALAAAVRVSLRAWQ